jgi:hypothetical protein
VLRELAGARKAFSEKIAERQSVMEPHEDPDYEDPKCIMMHSLAYTIEGLMARMIAELVSVISL